MTDIPLSAQPVIIIGAGRSGTNMLRDMLTQLPGVGTWPCDEINYIWRRHNARLPHDEFSPAEARSEVRRYIQRAFNNIARRQKLDVVVEKTCANSLRVGFVNAVVPRAKYLFLIRDGYDVAASAAKCWTSPLDIPYILKKARYVPAADVPYYALRYVGHRLRRLLHRQRRLPTWGPRFIGIQQALAEHSLEEVCALQWARCVRRSLDGISKIQSARVLRLTYEELVNDPQGQLRHILHFLGLAATPAKLAEMTKGISASSVGNGRRKFSTDVLQRLESIVEPALNEVSCRTQHSAGRSAAA